MSYYKICDLCGARLDPGEHCDCQRAEVGAAARMKSVNEGVKLAVPPAGDDGGDVHAAPVLPARVPVQHMRSACPCFSQRVDVRSGSYIACRAENGTSSCTIRFSSRETRDAYYERHCCWLFGSCAYLGVASGKDVKVASSAQDAVNAQVAMMLEQVFKRK